MYLNLKTNISSKKLLLLTITAFLFFNSNAQLREGYKADIEVQTIGTTNGVVPFWMRSNQFGSVPLSGLSGAAIGRISKSYSELTPNEEIYGREKLMDWGFGIEGRANGGKNSNLQLIEAYAKGRFSIFQLKVGRNKDVMGLNGDTSLSSGNFAVSGNALGIPKIELSIPDYWRIPILDGVFSMKGNFVHGWVGKFPITDTVFSSTDKSGAYVISTPETFYHQKSLYIRLGKDDWRLNLYGGFNHQVHWGNEKVGYGDNFKLSDLETFMYVITGKAYGAPGVPRSKIGNQLGSIDLGMEYKFDNFNVMLYRQSIYDVGALSKLANIKDGLNGISIENRNFTLDKYSKFQFKKVVLELFSTKDQAGYPWSKRTASGDEDYYNNFFYVNGWSYKKLGLGNPLITRRDDAREGQATKPSDYFINNRVVAIHLGLTGSYLDWLITTKATYSWNYGTFGTSIYGKSRGGVRLPLQTKNIFEKVNQFSFLIEGLKNCDNGYYFGGATSIDAGKLLPKSFGLQIKLGKTF